MWGLIWLHIIINAQVIISQKFNSTHYLLTLYLWFLSVCVRFVGMSFVSPKLRIVYMQNPLLLEALGLTVFIYNINYIAVIVVSC